MTYPETKFKLGDILANTKEGYRIPRAKVIAVIFSEYSEVGYILSFWHSMDGGWRRHQVSQNELFDWVLADA